MIQLVEKVVFLVVCIKVGRNAEVAIVSGDKTLYITESNELGSTTAIVRDSSTGKLSLVGVDGELISEVTIPISEKGN